MSTLLSGSDYSKSGSFSTSPILSEVVEVEV